MRTNLGAKTAFIIAILLVFVFGIFGFPHGLSGTALKNAITDRIHLGLDLRGGTHLILQVMVDEAVGSDADSDAARIQTDLAARGVTGATVSRPDPKRGDQLRVSGVSPDKNSDVRSVIGGPGYSSTYEMSSTSDGAYLLTMKPGVVQSKEKAIVAQSIETIRRRVDSLGVSEPQIQEYGLGKNQILVELPGVDDPSRVRDVIQSTARLEIHAVNGGPYTTEAEAAQTAGSGDNVILQWPAEGNRPNQWYVLERASIVSGTDFKQARPGQDVNGRPDVEFFLTRDAGDKFYAYTSANIQKAMAIVLDNTVREVATIQSGIRDTGNITGGFTKEQADDLSLTLSTGSLPASIHYLEERTVGPSLGADSIRAGVTASIIGMLAVMVFMLLYYRGAGINADLALFLNLVILLGFMGFTGSTLTLPGIAGVILTIGMGVDSNVLIFERIREELHLGKSQSAAVDQGFAHAWITIVDTHVTTIVSAAILFLFGTGPVKGFAVTLTFGLLANLFTAVFVSRVIFESNLKRHKTGEALSI
jgi:preprotein translocase subunit SecD